ncbi:MAG: hypothetical protein RLZZ15_712 [Verrucomicrobiota bacterium]
MKTRLIVNPRSGHAAAALPAVRAFAERTGAELALTERPQHATALAVAAAAAGCELVVAVGGDGTMNEVARGLVGTRTALGLVPLGSGNGLARHLRIPLATPAALALLAHGRIHRIDAGDANGHLFFCAAGCGFDTAVLRRFNRLPRRGFTAYLVAATIEFFRYAPAAVTVRLDDDPPVALRPLLLGIANASQFGNGARLAPRASLFDGRLNLVAVPALGPLASVPLLWRLFRGTLHLHPRVRTWAAERIEIERASPAPMQVDGELVDTTARISIRVRPDCLRVLGP